MGEYRVLFDFIAKSDALKDYLHEGKKVESLYDWVSNIERMYANPPDGIKEDTTNGFSSVLTRTMTYGGNVLGRK